MLSSQPYDHLCCILDFLHFGDVYRVAQLSRETYRVVQKYERENKERLFNEGCSLVKCFSAHKTYKFLSRFAFREMRKFNSGCLDSRVITIALNPITFPRLEFLDLSFFTINVPRLSGFTSLKGLSFHHSYHVFDFSQFEFLTELRELDLSYTYVTDISHLRHLKNLESLNLGSTYITDISVFRHLTKLKKLNLRDARMTDVSPLEFLTNLEELDLSHGNIHSIDCLHRLTSLKVFSLRRNTIANISVVSFFEKLEQLDINGTKISDISPLSRLRNLKQLIIAGSLVTRIPRLDSPDVKIY